MHEIICGDMLDVLPSIDRRAQLVFADPPDNLQMPYKGFNDSWPTRPEYLSWLSRRMWASFNAGPSVIVWSLWPRNFLEVWPVVSLLGRIPYEIRQFIWRYTFGQHFTHDCGQGYRTLLRFSKPDTLFHTDRIRVPSARQLKYNDKRANPKGRVPDDVWEFPRVCGTFKERRSWAVTQHPEALLERLILMATDPGDLVIDLFAHSGTTMRVCHRLGRDSIHIDISEYYCSRLQEELQALEGSLTTA